MRRARFLFWLDVTLLLLFAALEEPVTTGLAGHEWISLGFALLILLHLLVNWRWIAAAVGRYRTSSQRARFNAWLNGTLFVLMVLTIFSGFVISRFVLPTVGLEASALQIWRPIHTVIASVTLAVVGLHVALNWDWIVGAVRQLRTRRHLTSALSFTQRLDLDGFPRVTYRFVRLVAATIAVCGLSLLLVSGIARTTIDKSALPAPAQLDFGEGLGELSMQLLIIAVSAFIGHKVLRIKL